MEQNNKTLEFLKVVKTSSDPKQVEKIIEEILKSNLVYNLQLFLNEPNVAQLNKNENGNAHYNTLSVFSQRSYLTYKQQIASNPAYYIKLDDNMIKKLKLLNLLDLTKEKKNISLDFIQKTLDISDSFEVHSMIFEAVNQGLMSGKIDHKSKLLKVLNVKGLNSKTDKNDIKDKLDKWISNVENVNNLLSKEIEDLRAQTSDFNANISNKTKGIEILTDLKLKATTEKTTKK